MPSVYTTSNFLQTFQGAYETLDVRAAIVSYQKQWLLVALSAHVRVDSIKTAKEEFSDIIKQFGGINCPTFQILQQCYSIVDTESFFQNISKGQLILDNIQIALSEPLDLLSMPGNIHTASLDTHISRWPYIEQQRLIAMNNQVVNLLFNDATILRTAETVGYETPHAAVKKLLDIDFSSSSQPSVWISCDIPIRLCSPEVTRLGKELHLKLRAEAHPTIQDLSCMIRWTGPYGSNVTQQLKVELTRSSINRNPTLWCGDVKLPLNRDNHVTLETISSKVGKLCTYGIRPFDFLPSEQSNPLLAALQMFCSLEQICLLLSEPHKVEAKPKNNSNAARLFEATVQWLLSTLGFYAVWLDRYEKLKDDKMEYGTVDCLAYSEEQNLLLLVNCSLTAPDLSEFGKHVDLATRLSSQLYPDERVKVQSTLFTASAKPNTGEQRVYGSAIKVFYKEDIDQLVQTAQSGQRLGHLHFMPFFSSFQQ